MIKPTNGLMVCWLIWLDNALEINLQKNIGLSLMDLSILYGFSL